MEDHPDHVDALIHAVNRENPSEGGKIKGQGNNEDRYRDGVFEAFFQMDTDQQVVKTENQQPRRVVQAPGHEVQAAPYQRPVAAMTIKVLSIVLPRVPLPPPERLAANKPLLAPPRPGPG